MEITNGLDKAIAQAEGLSLEELQELQKWLQGWIALKGQERQEQELQIRQRADREVVGVRKAKGGYYQLEYIKCGKPKCKCTKGKGHGPYWYAYWSEGGKTRSKYIGKKLPGQDSAESSTPAPGAQEDGQAEMSQG